VKTDIEYLRELEEHLMVAARREAEPAAVTAKPRLKLRWRRFSTRMVAAGVAAFLAIAGVIGYFATQGSPVEVSGVLRQEEFHGVQLPSIEHKAAGRNSAPGGPSDQAAIAPAAEPSPAPQSSAGVPSGGSVVGPSIIKTAELSIRVPKGTFDQQYGKATEIAGANGGYVATSTVEDGKTDSGTITIRVPADQFEAALNELRGLGHVDRESVSGQDVTARFVDLAARLRNAQDKVVVLRRLLAKAPTVAATLRVSNTLSNAELEVEELQGQIRALQSRTDLGTIQMSLYERAPQKPIPPPTATHHTIGGAWKHAVKGFFGVVYSVVVGLGYLVPITALLALVALLLWLGVRRARNRVAV
jgi:hypothetical protein